MLNEDLAEHSGNSNKLAEVRDVSNFNKYIVISTSYEKLQLRTILFNFIN